MMMVKMEPIRLSRMGTEKAGGTNSKIVICENPDHIAPLGDFCYLEMIGEKWTDKLVPLCLKKL